MLVIRSQNRLKLTTDLNLYVKRKELDCLKVVWKIKNKTVGTIGKYDSQEDAIKVLYEIGSLSSKLQEDDFCRVERRIFDMPYCDEVKKCKCI